MPAPACTILYRTIMYRTVLYFKYFASKVPSSPPTLTVHRPPPGPYIGIHSHDVSFLIITEKILEINNIGDNTISEGNREGRETKCTIKAK